jgi:hypothetical protein
MKGVTLEENRKHLAVRDPGLRCFTCCTDVQHVSYAASGHALASEHFSQRGNTCGLCLRPLPSWTPSPTLTDLVPICSSQVYNNADLGCDSDYRPCDSCCGGRRTPSALTAPAAAARRGRPSTAASSSASTARACTAGSACTCRRRAGSAHHHHCCGKGFVH